jgi:hypothetical protein
VSHGTQKCTHCQLGKGKLSWRARHCAPSWSGKQSFVQKNWRQSGQLRHLRGYFPHSQHWHGRLALQREYLSEAGGLSPPGGGLSGGLSPPGGLSPSSRHSQVPLFHHCRSSMRHTQGIKVIGTKEGGTAKRHRENRSLRHSPMLAAQLAPPPLDAHRREGSQGPRGNWARTRRWSVSQRRALQRSSAAASGGSGGNGGNGGS